MSKSTISTFELFAMFPDQEAAREYLEARLWPNGARCPVCGLGDRITVRTGGYYRCNQCKEDFTVRTGTIFERSHVPLHKWIYAMYLLVTARKGISSHATRQGNRDHAKVSLVRPAPLARSLRWPRPKEARRHHRNRRNLCRRQGSQQTRHKKLKAGRGTVGKTPVFGMRERGGRTVAMPIRRHRCRHNPSRNPSECRDWFNPAHGRSRRICWHRRLVFTITIPSITAMASTFAMT